MLTNTVWLSSLFLEENNKEFNIGEENSGFTI